MTDKPADELPPPDWPERLPDYLRRRILGYRVPVLIGCGAIELKDPEGRIRPGNDPSIVVAPGTWGRVLNPLPPVCVNRLQNLSASEYRDYAAVPLGRSDLFLETMSEFISSRPQTQMMDASATTSLRHFILAATGRDQAWNSLHPPSEPMAPVRDLVLITHASSEGLYVPIWDGAHNVADYEDLEIADKDGSLRIPPELLQPRPPNTGGQRPQPRLLIRGCDIGKAKPYLSLLKKALGGVLTVVAPIHADSAVQPDSHSARAAEFMNYDFRVILIQRVETTDQLIRTFEQEARRNPARFQRIDKSKVSRKDWSEWIPQRRSGLHRDWQVMPKKVRWHIDNRRVKVKGWYRYIEDRLFTKDAGPTLDKDPGSEADRIAAVVDSLRKLPRYTDAHPWPMYRRLGFDSLSELALHIDWSFKWDSANKKLRTDAKLHTYVLHPPILEPGSDRLLVNWYPTSGGPMVELSETDSRFFSTV